MLLALITVLLSLFGILLHESSQAHAEHAVHVPKGRGIGLIQKGDEVVLHHRLRLGVQAALPVCRTSNTVSLKRQNRHHAFAFESIAPFRVHCSTLPSYILLGPNLSIIAYSIYLLTRTHRGGAMLPPLEALSA